MGARRSGRGSHDTRAAGPCFGRDAHGGSHAARPASAAESLLAHGVRDHPHLTLAMPAQPPDPTPASAAPAGTLRHLLRGAPRLAPDHAARLLAAVARALAAWHARGGTHGGAYGALAPERVLVGAGDAVTLAPPPRQDGAPAPWPTYLAPEQIDGRTGDARSDVYALGLVGWELLAGQQPWEGESLYGVVVKQREQDLPRLSTLRPGLPRPLVAAIEGCLHKAPGDRWQSAAEFLSALAPTLPTAAPTVEMPGVGARGAAAAAARAPLPPAGPLADAVARVSAAGAVPGVESAAAMPVRAAAPIEPRPEPRPEPRSEPRTADARPAALRDAEPDPDARARRAAAPRRRGRRLAGAALGLALLGAAAAAAVVVRDRDTARGAAPTWTDSLATAPGGSAAGEVGAAAAATTTENTTAVPVRRTGGSSGGGGGPRVTEPPVAYDSAPPADTVVADPTDVPPVLGPTPPYVPSGAPAAGTARSGRPSVPRPTVPGPDTLAAPDSLT